MPRRPVHPITTADADPFFFLHSDRGPNMPWAPFVGLLWNGERFHFDVHQAYGDGLIAGLSRFLLGEIGFRKSTEIKIEIKRYLKDLKIPRRFLIFDYKFEYEDLCREMGIEPLSFEHMRINPIDPKRLNRNEQQAMLANLVQLARRRFEQLPDREYGALSAALNQVVAEKIPQNLMTVRDALRKPTEDAAKALGISQERLFEMGFELALVLDRFIGDGDLGGVFDGETSPEFDLTGNLVVINFSTIDESMRPLVVSVVSTWLESAWQHGNKDLLFDHVILEECWEYLRHLVFARWARKGAKLQRVYGVAYTYVLHALSDLTSAGKLDSEEVQLALGLVRDSQIQVLFRQAPGERELLKTTLGLNELALDIVTKQLQPGQMLWIFGKHMLIVTQVLTEYERRIVVTDARIAEKYLEPDSIEGAELVPAIA